MFEKIDPREIIRDHLNTLVDFNTDRLKISDFFVFFGLPLIAGWFLLSVLDIRITRDVISIAAASLSIFAALLFNFLLLAFDLVRKYQKDGDENQFVEEGLSEIYANISFSIFVSILSVVLLLVNSMGLNMLATRAALEYGLNLIIYWLIGVFVLTQFMVLRRIHILLGEQFR